MKTTVPVSLSFSGGKRPSAYEFRRSNLERGSTPRPFSATYPDRVVRDSQANSVKLRDDVSVRPILSRRVGTRIAQIGSRAAGQAPGATDPDSRTLIARTRMQRIRVTFSCLGRFADGLRVRDVLRPSCGKLRRTGQLE